MSIARENRDLTSGNLFKKLIIYLIPLFLANALQLLFTTMDLMTVTHFGGGNLSSGAIGATNNLINLIVCTFWGITSGASIVISNGKGAHDQEKVKKAIGSSILIIFIASIFVLFFGIFCSKKLLIALDTDEVFLENSTKYLMIYFIGAPFNLLYNLGANILRACGDTKRPLIAVVISGIINICLNFLFVIVFNLDVAGVAIATIMSQAVSMVIVFWFLMRDKRLSTNFSLKYLHFYKEESIDILKLGLTSGLQGFIFNFTNVFVQKCVNQLGAEAVIGKAAASNIEGYEYALLNSISLTCTVSVGQNYGANNISRMKKSLLVCVLFELILETSFNSIILALNKPLLSIFISNAESNAALARELAVSSLIIWGLPYALCGIAECASGYLRGMKYSVTPTIVSLLCIVGVRMTFILFMFNLPQFHNYKSLILAYPISWSLCCLVYIPICIFLSKKKFSSINNNLIETVN